MKRRLFSMILICLGVILMFNACNDTNSDPLVTTGATTAAQTTTAATTEEPQTPTLTKKLLINGTDITEFRIVYAAVPTAEAEAYAKYQGQLQGDTEFDRLTAEHLAEVIKNFCGAELEVVEDQKSEPVEREILVGKTNRFLIGTEGLSDQDLKSFDCRLLGENLVIAGGCYGATWQAVEAFDAWLNEERTPDESNTVTLDLSDATDLSGTADLKAVACLGDSITFGATSTDPTYFSYPATLQRMMWREYLVYNYGANGRTMRDDSAVKAYNGQVLAYMECSPYFDCMQSTVSFDAVLIMLGTNDAGNDPTWNDADDARYLENGHELVKSIKAKNRNAKIVIMNCPSRYSAETAAYPHVRALQLQFAQELAEKGNTVYHYDMYGYCTDNINASFFPDVIHPNDNGYKLVANGIKDLLAAVFENAENTYLTDCTK